MTPAFKEWAIVCEALGAGKQSIIIRKGGIAEGREGFSFRHREFLLFPTWFHEQLTKTRLPAETILPEQNPELVEIHYTANLEWSCVITRREQLSALREHHILADDVVEERFAYDECPGVHVAILRVFRLEPPCIIPMQKRYGGCRSWVDLPDLEGHAMVSVLSDEEHDRRLAVLRRILS
jgi:hypothetical protein